MPQDHLHDPWVYDGTSRLYTANVVDDLHTYTAQLADVRGDTSSPRTPGASGRLPYESSPPTAGAWFRSTDQLVKSLAS